MAGALPGTTRPESLITNWLEATKTFEVQGQLRWEFQRVSVKWESENRKEVTVDRFTAKNQKDERPLS